jgi:hypothetical protein
VPRVKITEADWPDADADAINEVAPVLWGYHNSASLTGEGMVGTLYVDTVGYRYLVSLGHMNSVPTVYKNGVTVASGYSIVNVTVNGKLWTLIDFTTDQADATITCEVEGLTDAYDGSGSLLTNPVAQLRQFLTLFVFNNWAGGPYPTTTRIDEDSFSTVQAILEERSTGGALRLGGGETTQRALTVLENWCAGFGCYPYWTLEGKLALGLLPWEPAGDYPDTLIKQSQLHEPPRIQLNTNQLCREVEFSHLYGDADGKYFRSIRVQDTTVAERVTLAREHPYGPSKVI